MRKSLVLTLAMFMVIGFSGLASAAMITFNVNTTQPINIGETFTVDIVLEAEGAEGFLTLNSFGAFFDYDDYNMQLVGATPSPNWVDKGVFIAEPNSSWYTATGWTSMGYTAPANFEEGSDILVMSLLSLSSPLTTAEGFAPIPLGSLEFTCVGPGDSFLLAMNRPDNDYVLGTIGDDDIAWDASLTRVSAVPIPGAVLLFGSGLLGLLGIGIRRKTKK